MQYTLIQRVVVGVLCSERKLALQEIQRIQRGEFQAGAVQGGIVAFSILIFFHQPNYRCIAMAVAAPLF